MSELPLGWAHASLGEIAETIRGVTYKKAEAESEPGDEHVPMLRATNVVGGRLDLDSQLVYVPAKRVSNAQFLAVGDIVIASSSGSTAVVGKSAPLRHEWSGTFGAFCMVARPRLAIEASYLAYFVGSETVRRRWSRLASGTNINNLKRDHFTETPVPLPPLNEQRRIVAAIEEQFSRLDAADASLAQAKRRGEAFVGATVAAALGGDWEIVALSDVTESQVYGTSSKASSDPGGVPVLRMGNINGGRLDLSNLKYLPADHPDVAKFTLEPGDVLFNRTNSPELVGKSAVFTGSEHMTFASYLIRVRLIDNCDPRWAVLVINGPPGRRYIASVRSQQVGQANVNGTKLAAMPIPLPPLEEQRRIVAEVEERLSVIDAMRTSISNAQRRSAALRASILERAFHGELVPQDPSDEPASVLFDRIRAERAAAGRAT